MLPTVRRAPTASICATHCASPTFPDSKTCPGNTCRSTRAGCCPDSERMSSGTSCGVSNTSTPAGWPYNQRRSANHCRRAPAASCRSAGVAGRVTANAMPSVTSPRVAASGHKACTVWAPARGNAPAVKANVAASARRHISATEPKRDAARAPPREHDVAKNGDRSNLTAAPIREQAVGRCHVMPCREPIHGQRGPAPRDSAVSSS